MAGHQRTADTPADGRTPQRAADRRTRGGALYYGWAYMLALWGKGGCGGSPNVEAGKRGRKVGREEEGKGEEGREEREREKRRERGKGGGGEERERVRGR
jgi:hypothetical protein